MAWLDEISVAEPCQASWDAMAEREGGRFCGRCNKTVHDLSSLTRSEAERMARQGGPLCVRFLRASDGTVVTRDRPMMSRVWLAGAVLTLELASGVARADLTTTRAEGNRIKTSRPSRKPPKPLSDAPRLPDEIVEHVPKMRVMNQVLGAMEVFSPPTRPIRACYDTALATNPELAGQMTLELTVRKGHVEHAAIVRSTINDLGLETCIIDAAKQWDLGTTEGPETVTYPLLFANRK